MKIRLFYFLSILSIIQISCYKESNKKCEIPENCLPALTESGANTAGCLVDGKVLVPDGDRFGSGAILKSQYYVTDEYTLFFILIRDLSSRNNPRDISLELRKGEIEEGKTYNLTVESQSTDFATFSSNGEEYKTNNENKGEIHFSKFDPSRRIAAGTFWFNGRNEFGEIVEVTKGRFDVLFY